MKNLSFYKQSTMLKSNHKGNVFALIFAAVGLVGVLGVVGIQTISGPVRTITQVTQKNITDTDLLTNARIVILNASTLPSDGDGDADGYIEPIEYIATTDPNCDSAPTGGGCLPTTIGAILTDPWGTDYGYCVWDHGSVDGGRDDGGTGTDNRLQGEDSTSQPVLAIISAGPNRTFDTTCGAFDSAGVDGLSDPEGADDDTVRFFTYSAALAGSGGLWSEVGNDAQISNPDVTDEVILGGGARIDIAGANTGTAGTGTFPAVRTDTLTSLSGTPEPVEMAGGFRVDNNTGVPNGDCAAGTDAGILRWNTTGTELEVCDGSSFVSIGSGGIPDEISDTDGDTKVQVEEGADDDTFRVDIDGDEILTLSRSGTMNHDTTFSLRNSSSGHHNRLLFLGTGGGGQGLVSYESGTDFRVSTSSSTTFPLVLGTQMTPRVSIAPTGDVTILSNLINDGKTTLSDTSYDFANGGIAFGDGDSGIYESADDTLEIRISGTDRHVFSSGAISINSGSLPSVRGVTVGNPNFIPRGSDTDTGLGRPAADATNTLALYTDGTERIHIAANGNVGVGTLTPTSASLLEVNGSVLLGSSTCGVNEEGAIQYTNANNVEYCNGTSWQSLGGSVSQLRDITNVDIPSDPTDGYVLQWDNTAKDWNPVDPTGLTVSTASSSDQTALLIDDDDDTYIDVDTAGDGSADTINFFLDDDEVLTINGSGGSTTNNAMDMRLLNYASGSNNRLIFANGAGSSYAIVGYDGTNAILRGNGNSVSIETNTGGVGLFNDITTGTVVVGGSTVDSSAQLKVDSSARGFLPPRLANNGSVSSPADGLMIFNNATSDMEFYDGAGWRNMDQGASSDERLKKDIVSLDNVTEKLITLRPSYYYWRDEIRGTNKEIGLIAQDVEKVFPETVSTDGNGFLQLDYGRLVTPIIAAIQELWDIIQAIMADLTGLKQENEQLKAEVEALKETQDDLVRRLGVLEGNE